MFFKLTIESFCCSLSSLEREEQSYQMRLSAIANTKSPDPIGYTVKGPGSATKKAAAAASAASR